MAGLLVNGRVPWKWTWIPATVYVCCGIPAVFAGWSLSDMLFQMFQIADYGMHMQPQLTLGATNWYQWVFEHDPDVFWWPGVVLTLPATAFLVLRMQEPRPGHLTESQWLVSLATLSVLFPPFFLPGMQERYFFAADVLSVVYAFYEPRGFWVAILVQFASAFTYLPYLFNREPIPRPLLALAVLAALALVVREVFVPARIQEQTEAAI